MNKWYFGRELIEMMGWAPMELFNHVKEGLPAYDDLGRRVVDRDTLPLKQKQTYEEIETMMRSKFVPEKYVGLTPDYLGGPKPKLSEMTPTEIFNNINPLHQGCPVPISLRAESSEEMILKLSKALYEGQPDEPLVPADCVAISLALPVNPEWVQNFLERFQSFKYKYGEVIDFERQHGLAAVEDYTETPASSVPSGMAAEEPDIPAVSPIQSEKQADPDAFVRSLIVVYESDSEVKIKVGAGKYTVYSCEDMGFKETAKPWVALITIIKDRAHLYNVGYKNSSTYEKNRGELRAISKKLVEFFNKTYKVQLPDNFMMFEPAKNEDAGMYGPKFSISIFGEDKDYASLPLGDLKTEIETLSEKNKQLSQYKDKSRRKTDDDEERQQLLKEQNIIEDKLNAAITVALEKKVITSDHVKDYYPKKSIGEENAETIEKDIFGDMQRKYHHAAAYSSLFGDRPSKEDD